jgi:hypothetical protein
MRVLVAFIQIIGNRRALEASTAGAEGAAIPDDFVGSHFTDREFTGLCRMHIETDQSQVSPGLPPASRKPPVMA